MTTTTQTKKISRSQQLDIATFVLDYIFAELAKHGRWTFEALRAEILKKWPDAKFNWMPVVRKPMQSLMNDGVMVRDVTNIRGPETYVRGARYPKDSRTNLTMTTTIARLYVGTYDKYNRGDISGKWMNLQDYPDREAFLSACAALHADEHDPELMFQDFEGFPRQWYQESTAPPAALWEWLALSHADQQLLQAYVEHVNTLGTIEQARQSLTGTGSSKAHLAEDYHSEALKDVPEFFQRYINWDAVARDMEDDFTFVRVGDEVWLFLDN